MSNKAQVRRIYDDVEPTDGARVLVDRLWPRGISKERAHLTEWCKEIAPSPELRKWYAHDPEKYPEFVAKYQAELESPDRARLIEHLRDLQQHEPLTLLTASKRADISEAEVLVEILNRK